MLLPDCAGSPPRQLDLMPAPVANEQTDTPFGMAEATIPSGAGALDTLYATNHAPVDAGDDGNERYYSVAMTGRARGVGMLLLLVWMLFFAVIAVMPAAFPHMQST